MIKDGSNSKKRFHEESNMQYSYRVNPATEDRAELLLENPDAIIEMVEHHIENQVPRLLELYEYYEGNNVTILTQERRKEKHLSDHRATHNFANYVSNFIQGYLVGVPIKTAYLESDKIDNIIMEINRENDADEHNSNIVLDQSIYGRAYELLYRNQQDETKFTALSVFNTFIITDDTVEENPIAGVRYLESRFGEPTTILYVYTQYEIITYQLDDGKLIEQQRESHGFGGIQVIEYKNNKFRQGDFDSVLNLIDLYDASESDTANYMTDLNDAMLVISGNLKIDSNQAQSMKENNLMLLEMFPDEHGRVVQATAEYIYKQYDVAGTEAYKSRIEADIHKFTNTPNMNDEEFGGVQSGEAMKYKLFGLEQVRATKERMFKRSLRDRYRLISNMMNIVSEGELVVNNISITFTPNLPKSVADEIESFVKLGGQLSEESKIDILSFIESSSEEMEKLSNENPQEQSGRDLYSEFEEVRNRMQVTPTTEEG